MEILRFTRKELVWLMFATATAFMFGLFVLQWSDRNMKDFDEFAEAVTMVHEESKAEHNEDIQKEDIYDKIPQRSDMLKQLNEMKDSNVAYGYDFNVDRIEYEIKEPLQYATSNKLPIILWWTPFTGDMGSIKKCTYGRCFFSQDRSLFGHHLNKVFLFYGTSFNESDLPLPRASHHEWAVLHEESPKNNPLFYHEDFIALFNHTSTFRRYSDYPITTQYVNSLEELKKPSVMTFQEKDELEVASTIFLQSGCNPPSDRDAYIYELMKYMKVDSYGACLNNKRLPELLKSPLTMHDDQLREFVGKYKFALTFENAICEDYITEKLWRPLAAGTVPIYKGASNVHEWLPDGKAVIFVDDFKSPKDLAEYLTYLSKNETEYMEYLNFKTKGITNQKLLTTMKTREWGVNDLYKMSFITGFECFICDRVHENKIKLQKGELPLQYIANISHYGCPKPSMYPFRSPPGTDDWERETWALEYDDAKYTAKKLKNLVENS